MTKLFLILFSLGILTSKSEKLIIVVKNIEVGKGTINVAVFDSDKDFLKKPIFTKCLKPDKESLELSFDLPEGTYAVTVYQDINNNKELDKGLFNIPKEPFGLSNNFRPSFAAPTFNDCKFTLTNQLKETITLK